MAEKGSSSKKSGIGSSKSGRTVTITTVAPKQKREKVTSIGHSSNTRQSSKNAKRIKGKTPYRGQG